MEIPGQVRRTMRRVPLLATVAVVLAVLALVPFGGLAAGEGVVAQVDGNETVGNGSDAEAAPGERLSGILGVQGAEIQNEVESRAFGIQVAQATSENARAGVVADRLASIEERINELEERKARLERARENGSLGDGAYGAQVAQVAAEMAGAKQLVNQSANASQGLPADVLAERGINASAIQSLSQRASDLGGPDVAAIARSIAGPGVGQAPGGIGPTAGVPGDGDGPPTRDERAGNVTSDRPNTDRGGEPPEEAGAEREADDPEEPSTTTATETERRPDGAGIVRGR